MDHTTLSAFEIAADALNALMLRKRYAAGARSATIERHFIDLDKGVVKLYLVDGRCVQYVVTLTGKVKSKK